MLNKEQLLPAIIAGVNVMIGATLNYLTYVFVGAAIFIVDLLFIVFLRNSNIARWIIVHEIQYYETDDLFDDEGSTQVLVSVALLSLNMKLAAGIGLFVETGAFLCIVFAILLASGYLFEGLRSGMTLGGALSIGKILVKIATFFSSIWEKMIILIAKVEFAFLGIELREVE